MTKEIIGPDALEILNYIGDTSIELFGNKDNPLPTLKHLQKEVIETIESPSDIFEYSDMLILLLGAYKRTGGDVQQLLAAALEKTYINKYERTWGEPDGDGVRLHIKEG